MDTTFDSYQESAWSCETIVNALCSITWIGITYTNVSNAIGVEEITLSSDTVIFIVETMDELPKQRLDLTCD